MREELNPDKVLRLTDDLEEVRLPEGLVLLKQTRLARYLAVSEPERRLLAEFDGNRPLAVVVRDLLGRPDRPPLRRVHDLLDEALDRGIIIDTDGDLQALGKPPPSCPWPLGWGRSLAVLSTLLFVVVGSYGFFVVDLMPQQADLHLAFLGKVYLWLMAGMSLTHVLAACVLRGFGRTVYRPRLGLTLFVLHFKIDTRDTFMGGRPCMVAVALQMLSAPFILVAVAAMLRWPALVTGGLLTLFCLTWPFGRTPVHALLVATLSNRYETDLAGTRFLGRRLLPQMLDWSVELKEGAYLTGYTVYTLVWMAVLVVLGLAFFHHHAGWLIRDLLDGQRLDTRLSAALVIAAVLFGVLGPLLYEVVLVLSNVYSLLAPRWFTAERRARTASAASKPPVDDIADLLRDILLFAKLPTNKLRAVAETMSYQHAPEGTILLRQGDVGDHLYVLYAGELEVLADDESGARHVIARIYPKTVFGEISLLAEQPRTASIRVSKEAGVLALANNHVERLIVGELGRRQAVDVIRVGNFFNRVEMFSRWPRDRVTGISGQFEIINVDAGEQVIEEGQENTAFYLIVEGRFKVMKDRHQVSTLSTGSGFGEISLLHNVPATATVEALTAGRLVRLDRDSFATVVCRDFEAGFALEALVAARLGNDAAVAAELAAARAAGS